MSDTPKTDAACTTVTAWDQEDGHRAFDVVPVEFAREQERRIAQLEQQAKDATKKIDSLLPRIEALVEDETRLYFLESLVRESVVNIVTCSFELDGGVHLTIERPSQEPETYRYQKDLRTAIDHAREKVSGNFTG